MILLDTNLLVYAFIESFPQHSSTKKWLEQQLSSMDRVALPWAALLGFIRVCSNKKIFANPASIQACWAQVSTWLDHTTTWIPLPKETHQDLMGELLGQIGNKAGMVPDAHLAALAIDHELTLCSADRGFRRFQELQWHNPLAATT